MGKADDKNKKSLYTLPFNVMTFEEILTIAQALDVSEKVITDSIKMYVEKKQEDNLKTACSLLERTRRLKDQFGNIIGVYK